MPGEPSHLSSVIVVPHRGHDGLSFRTGTRELHGFSKDLFRNINCGFHASNLASKGFSVNVIGQRPRPYVLDLVNTDRLPFARLLVLIGQLAGRGLLGQDPGLHGFDHLHGDIHRIFSPLLDPLSAGLLT